MFDVKGKIKTQEFTDYIASLLPFARTNIVKGFNEKEILTRILKDTNEMIEHNEWGIALENLLDILYEIEFRLDLKAIGLAKESILSSGLDYEKWKFIEELKK